MSLTISATALAQLAQTGACLRCFWVKLKSKRLPYQQFPGIFSSIDRYVKQVTRRHFDHAGKLPDWFPPVGQVITLPPVPHFTRFRVTEPGTDVTLRGEPDVVVQLPGPTYHILDYKTARLSEAATGFFPVYQAQLNAYAYIANRTFFSPVSGLGLLYLDPDTNVDADPSLLARTGQEFLLGFTPHLRPVPLEHDSFVEGLLAQARSLYERPTPPPSNPGCTDCQAIEELFRLAGTAGGPS
ncbi:MAG: PD-(D/E)XK nuclease family protein [Chloroflexi bacterium]|nr:PD-(D/E)XK nuclease family protein [Chloroflexota bacterium]